MTGFPKTPNKVMTKISYDLSKSNNKITNSNERSPLLQTLSSSPGLSSLHSRSETEPDPSKQYSPLVLQTGSTLLPKVKIKLTKSNSQAERVKELSPFLGSPQIENLQKVRLGSMSERTKTPGKLPPLENYQESPRCSLHKKSSLSLSSNRLSPANSIKVFSTKC